MNLNNLTLLKARFGNQRNYNDLIDTLAAINKPPLSMVQGQIPFLATTGVEPVAHALGAVPSTYRVGIQLQPGFSDLGWNAGTVIDGSQVWTLVNAWVNGVSVSNGGSGYSSVSPPAISFTGGGGTGATAVAVVNGSGVITAINMTAGGTGYTTAPQVVIAGSGGAIATASLSGNVYAPALSSVVDAVNVYIVQSVEPVDLYIFNNPNTGTPALSPLTNFIKWSYFVYASLDYIVTQASDPFIVIQPASVAVTGPAPATFTVAATGTAPITYQWQYSSNSGNSWSVASGGVYTGTTTVSLTVGNTTTPTNLNNYQYRCVITNGLGTSIVSNTVTLSVS